MNYRYLGRTGLQVSELCLGTMQFGWSVDQNDSFDVLSTAYDAGINFIDTANIYSRWIDGNPGGVSERIIGNWLKTADVDRDQIVLATKVRGPMRDTGPNKEGLSRHHIMWQVEESLRRLQTDYIDLYQTHWFDENTPIDETLRAMDDLVRQGKVRHIGCSNYPAWRLTEATWAAEYAKVVRYETLQPHYSLVKRSEFERELQDVCETYGIGVIPYSPLGGGFLTGKYRKDAELPDSVRAQSMQRYMTDQNWALLDTMDEICAAHDKTLSQLALAWVMAQKTIVAPIIGPRTLAQLADNLGAADFVLSQPELAALAEKSAWR